MLKAIIIGNLGADPDEPRYTSDGRPFVRFNIASTYRGRGQDEPLAEGEDGGEQQTRDDEKAHRSGRAHTV